MRAGALIVAVAALACSNGGGAGSCWLGRDAGSCTDDSQCPPGDYCDFSSFETCAFDGGPPCDGGPLFCGPFGRALGGICLPDCGGGQGKPLPDRRRLREDYLACFASALSPDAHCAPETPCPHGGVCGIFGTPGPPGCVPDRECKAEAAPHLRSGSYCDCAGLICGGGSERGRASPTSTSRGGQSLVPRFSWLCPRPFDMTARAEPPDPA